MIFAWIKSKVALIAGGIAIAGTLAIHILFRLNRSKRKKILELQREIATAEYTERQNEAIGRFEEQFKAKVEPVNDESELDKLDSQRKGVDDKDDNYTSVSV